MLTQTTNRGVRHSGSDAAHHGALPGLRRPHQPAPGVAEGMARLWLAPVLGSDKAQQALAAIVGVLLLESLAGHTNFAPLIFSHEDAWDQLLFPGRAACDFLVICSMIAGGTE